MSFPSVLGLPSSLDYKLPPSVGDSCRSWSVHAAPDGITSVTSAVPPATMFVQDSTCAISAFGGGQIVSFSPPCGMGSNVFLSPQDTTLSFTLTYTTSATAYAVGTSTANSLNLIGSGASFFDTLVLYSNSVPIETIQGYNQLQNFLLQNTVNTSERNGGLSISMGCDSYNGVNGIDLGFAGASQTYKYSFTIPLMSVLGYNSDKLIPIGSLSNLQLQMTITNGNFPIVSYCATAAPTTQPTLSAFTLDTFSLNMKYVDVGEMSGALLRQTLQDGKWFIRSTTYTQSSMTVPANSAGTQQLLLQIRNSSVKSLLHYFNTSGALAICPNHIYDAIGINTNSRQLQIGAQYFPSRPLNDLARPSEAYCYLIQSLASVASPVKALGTSVTRDSYNCVYSTAPAGSDSGIVVPALGVRAAPSGNDENNKIIAKFPNSAYYGYDLERVNGSLLSGVNTRGTPPFVNINIASAPNVPINCVAWGCSDVILAFDLASQSVQAFI